MTVICMSRFAGSSAPSALVDGFLAQVAPIATGEVQRVRDEPDHEQSAHTH